VRERVKCMACGLDLILHLRGHAYAGYLTCTYLGLTWFRMLVPIKVPINYFIFDFNRSTLL
jgi:hypothetical protein